MHSPEFDFERSQPNVAAAVKRLDVTWPVALDSRKATWNAYSNQYWPAEYLVDQQGRVAYFHAGEGDYDRTERAIVSLLGAGGTIAAAPPPAQDTQQTPELYAGSTRASHPNPIALRGSWSDHGEFVESTGPATVQLSFHAQEVYVVAEAAGSNAVTVGVTLDGKSVPDAQRGPGLTFLGGPGFLRRALHAAAGPGLPGLCGRPRGHGSQRRRDARASPRPVVGRDAVVRSRLRDRLRAARHRGGRHRPRRSRVGHRRPGRGRPSPCGLRLDLGRSAAAARSRPQLPVRGARAHARARPGRGASVRSDLWHRVDALRRPVSRRCTLAGCCLERSPSGSDPTCRLRARTRTPLRGGRAALGFLSRRRSRPRAFWRGKFARGGPGHRRARRGGCDRPLLTRHVVPGPVFAVVVVRDRALRALIHRGGATSSHRVRLAKVLIG